MRWDFRRKGLLTALAAGMLVTGCATTATVESRKQERPSAYEALTPELRSAVDMGQIKPGMTMDAVYIVWGNPGRTTQGGNESGETVTWFYYGTRMREVHRFGYYGYHTDYYPANYVRARVVFVNGLVKEWQSFGEPGY